jgi:selenocysteine lyase/cysteine desulfurase
MEGAMADRREFLQVSALAAAFAPLVLPASAQEEPAPAPASDDWAGIRSQFRLSPDFIHMSAMLLASHPDPVRQAIERHRDALDERTVAYIEQNNDKLQARARAAAGDYLSIDGSHIALTDSTTSGVGLVYGGLVLAPEDEILTTTEDYYVTYEATRLAALKTGASRRRIPLYDTLWTVTPDRLTDTIIDAVAPQTRVLALTWVHSSTGLKLPIAQIASRLAELNAERPEGREVLLCVDGVHAFGIEDFSFPELGADFLMAGCHKWLFGPRGTGIIAASRRGLDSIGAIVPSFVSERSFGAWIEDRDPIGSIDADTITPGGFKAFEHVWSLPEAFGFVTGIGKARIAERTHALVDQLKRGLHALEGVKLRTPLSADLSAGIVAFDLPGWNPHGVVRQLRARKVVASVAPYATQHVRLTPSILNTPEEVDAAIAAVHEIASA